MTLYCGAFVLTLGGGLAVYVKNLKSGAFALLWENPALLGNAATLVVCGNM